MQETGRPEPLRDRGLHPHQQGQETLPAEVAAAGRVTPCPEPHLAGLWVQSQECVWAPPGEALITL